MTRSHESRTSAALDRGVAGQYPDKLRRTPEKRGRWRVLHEAPWRSTVRSHA
jgi:hypothetical protein